VDPDYRSPSKTLLSAFLMPSLFASCSSPSGKAEKNCGKDGANQLRGRYFTRSKERGEGRFLFDTSSLPRLAGEGAVVDEGSVVARDMAGSEEDLEVGDVRPACALALQLAYFPHCRHLRHFPRHLRRHRAAHTRCCPLHFYMSPFFLSLRTRS